MMSATDQFTSRVYHVACLPGDGIGPEVMNEAIKVLKQIERISRDYTVGTSNIHQASKMVRFNISHGLIGGAAYVQYGCHLPEETVDLISKSDAVLLGSVGGPVNQSTTEPQWINAERNALLGLREKLNLGVNLRPAVIFPCMKHLSPLKDERISKGVDLLIVRELLGCVYFGEHKTEGDEATDIMRYTKSQIVKALEFAFHAAELQPTKERQKVTVVDKANVLDCSRLWRRTALELSRNFPAVQLEFMYVDTAALQLLLNPSNFSVIATGNLFGDILSDLASGLPGSLGLMPSVSFGKKIHVYEPAGGSAPDIAGMNKANPIAQILSLAMMLRYSFGMDTEASSIQQAVEDVLKEGIRTADLCCPVSKLIYSLITLIIPIIVTLLSKGINLACTKAHGAREVAIGFGITGKLSATLSQGEEAVTTKEMGDAIVKKLHDRAISSTRCS